MSRSKIKIPLPVALRMIGSYAAVRLNEQFRAVSFIVVYLVAFQMLVFGRAPAQALVISSGIALVVVGLAFFLEGLFLGLMPLAQRVGIQLSSRSGLKSITIISFLIGLGATLAEPAVVALRMVGGSIAAWNAPLLFFLLQRRPEWLILAIAIGVGAAVTLGILRLYLGISIKPLILIVMTIVLPLSLWAARSPNLASILGLAWDAGAITTGPVTVPLVLALSIGISRSSGRADATASGFGTVALASALPVIAVIVLGAILLPQVPLPSSESEFFAPENRQQTMLLFADEEALQSYALTHGSEQSRRLFPVTDENQAHPATARRFTGAYDVTSLFALMHAQLYAAARAILPLTIFLFLILLCLLRDRPRYLDEVFLGIAFALIGMCLLTTGIKIGLSQLGNEVGSRLPQVYRDTQVEKGRIIVHDFDANMVFAAASREPGKVEAFQLFDGKTFQTVQYRQEWHDRDQQIYTHYVHTSPLTHPELSRIGVLLILLFAFGMGYGSTIAEPALRALGRTVEDLTVGTVKETSVIKVVSIGVGVGLIVGVARILYDLPMIWILLPPYLLLFPLTLLNDEEFAGIAWDSGGVTTGAVTVPLVMAMGLGLGAELNISDGFGILAMGSAYPVVAFLLYGLVVRLRQRKILHGVEGVNNNA